MSKPEPPSGGEEALVWEFTSGILGAPDQLEAGLDRMIEQKRDNSRGDPEQEVKAWQKKLVEADRVRTGYQELTAKGLVTHEELAEKLRQLGETRKTAEHELKTIRERREGIEDLERDRDVLLESYASMVPGVLEGLTLEERHQVYKMLRLRVGVSVDGNCEVAGALGDAFSICSSKPTP